MECRGSRWDHCFSALPFPCCQSKSGREQTLAWNWDGRGRLPTEISSLWKAECWTLSITPNHTVVWTYCWSSGSLSRPSCLESLFTSILPSLCGWGKNWELSSVWLLPFTIHSAYHLYLACSTQFALCFSLGVVQGRESGRNVEGKYAKSSFIVHRIWLKMFEDLFRELNMKQLKM